MLGQMVFKVLSQKKEWQVAGMSSKDFDAESTPPPFRGYDYTINCIGVLPLIENLERTVRVNALFPHVLARTASAKIIHMSTDGVFSGRGGPYKEDSPQDCVDVYGKTKSLGEVTAPNVLNIRTSIIGPSPFKKRGLLEWFLSQPKGARIQGFTNHIWHGVTTLQFAELCAKIIERDVFKELRQESAVFHFAPNEPVTKYELLTLFKEVFNREVTITAVEDSRGAVRRRLATKYQGLKKLYPYDQSLKQAIASL